MCWGKAADCSSLIKEIIKRKLIFKVFQTSSDSLHICAVEHPRAQTCGDWPVPGGFGGEGDRAGLARAHTEAKSCSRSWFHFNKSSFVLISNQFSAQSLLTRLQTPFLWRVIRAWAALRWLSTHTAGPAHQSQNSVTGPLFKMHSFHFLWLFKIFNQISWMPELAPFLAAHSWRMNWGIYSFSYFCKETEIPSLTFIERQNQVFHPSSPTLGPPYTSMHHLFI